MTTLNDRSFAQKNENHLSQDTKNNVLAFIEADKAFSAKLEAFLAKHSEELLELDNLREKRNVKLDDAEQGIRRDADLAPRAKFNEKDGAPSISYGPFTVVKKLKEWFIPETFIALAERSGVHKSMVDSGAIQIKTEIDFDNACEYLRKNNMEKTFAAAKDASEMTPAISGPKPIPPFGAQAKKK